MLFRSHWGELGDGNSQLQRQWRLTPASISLLGSSKVVDIAVGFGHTLVLIEDGTVRAWGLNNRGQLGDGTTIDRLTAPVSVPLPRRAVAIATGGFHSLALLEDGTVFSWGSTDNGALGRSSRSFAEPRQIILLLGAKQIVASDHTSFALLSDGTVRGWGANRYGQLGLGHTSDRDWPVLIANLANISQITACGDHTLAVSTGGQVSSWGSNWSNQLGRDSYTLGMDRSVWYSPAAVPAMTAVRSAHCSRNASLAIRCDDSVWTWGNNYRGNLGDGSSISNRVTPQPVPGLENAKTAVAGYASFFILLRDGRLMGWGYNDEAQLGDGTRADRVTPVLLMQVDEAPATGAHPMAGTTPSRIGCLDIASGCYMDVSVTPSGLYRVVSSRTPHDAVWIDALQYGRLTNLRWRRTRDGYPLWGD